MKKYTIKKGNHRSGWFFKILKKPKVMKVTFMFDETAIYNLNNNDQFDWNKLLGFSRGFHQNNSIRIAWRWNTVKQVVELTKYEYVNGKRIMHEPLWEVKINEIATIVFNISDRKFCKWGYLLYPYFGGNQKAPHDINILIHYEVI